jgi:predicted  nucleic acid-binding Zn-ribbon protein
MFDIHFEKNFDKRILKLEEKIMSAIQDLMDSISALQAEDQAVVAAVLSLTQKVADLQSAIDNAANVDPQIEAAATAINAEITKLHNAVTPATPPAA